MKTLLNFPVSLVLGFAIVLALGASDAWAGEASLTWTAPTTNADGSDLDDLAGYHIYRKEGSGSYQQIDSTSQTSYTDTGLTAGVRYCYYVTAYDAPVGNQSTPSDGPTAVPASSEKCKDIPPPTCGDGEIESPEICEGDCPTSCDDGNSCTNDILMGDPNQCSSYCDYPAVAACQNNDGCCPSGCTSNNDNDCSASCGNGSVEPPELCDGACPVSCEDDDNSCTIETLYGDPNQCSSYCASTTIGSCQNNDGCCPSGCAFLNDNDCSADCGNGVKEGSEECDGDDFGSSSCGTEGFTSGDLVCQNNCTIDTSACDGSLFSEAKEDDTFEQDNATSSVHVSSGGCGRVQHGGYWMLGLVIFLLGINRRRYRNFIV